MDMITQLLANLPAQHRLVFFEKPKSDPLSGKPVPDTRVYCVELYSMTSDGAQTGYSEESFEDAATKLMEQIAEAARAQPQA